MRTTTTTILAVILLAACRPKPDEYVGGHVGRQPDQLVKVAEVVALCGDEPGAADLELFDKGGDLLAEAQVVDGLVVEVFTPGELGTQLPGPDSWVSFGGSWVEGRIFTGNGAGLEVAVSFLSHCQAP
jgi:hypothetical protein